MNQLPPSLELAADAVLSEDARGAREAVKAHIKEAAKIAQAVLAKETHND